MMQKPSALNWLVPLIIVLAVITAGTGLFAQGGEGPATFTTLHGQEVEIYGRGLYRHDALFTGAGFRGTDAVTLAVALPLLALSYGRYRQGSADAPLVMIGVLFYFLYNGLSMMSVAAFNSLFLFYTALFSSSLFAVLVALTTFEAGALSKRVLPAFPHRGLAIFMFVAGGATFLLWMSELVGPLLTGEVPELLGPYTTMFTHGFDSAVISPAAVLTGLFLLRRRPLGYLLAAPMLVFCTLNGVVVLGQTASQALAGIVLPVGVYIGMVGSWVVMGAFSIGLTRAFFRRLSPPLEVHR